MQTILPQDLISLSQAAKLLPPRHGKRVHVSTLYRWGKKGRITLFECNGIRVSETEIRSRFKVRHKYVARRGDATGTVDSTGTQGGRGKC